MDKTAKTVAKLVFIEFANAIRKLKLGEERWNPNVKETKYYEDYGLEYNPLFPNISKFKSTIIETLEIKLSNLNPEKLLGIDFVPELQDIKTHLNTFIKDIVNNFIKSTIKAVKIVLENTDHLAKMYNAYTVGFINGVIEFIARIAEFIGQLILLTFTYDGQQAFINTISEFWDKVSWDAVVKLISDTFGELFSYVKSTGGYKMAYDFGRFIPGLLELIIDIVAITKGAIRVVKKSKEIIGAFNNEIKRLEILATLNIDRKTLQALQEKDISIEIQPIYSSAQLSSGVPIKIPDGKKYHISYKDVIIETFDSDDKATNFLNQLLKNNPNEIKDLDFLNKYLNVKYQKYMADNHLGIKKMRKNLKLADEKTGTTILTGSVNDLEKILYFLKLDALEKKKWIDKVNRAMTTGKNKNKGYKKTPESQISIPQKVNLLIA